MKGLLLTFEGGSFMKRKNMLLLSLALILSLFICTTAYATTCDGTHVHSGDYSGLHIPCTGDAWTSSGKVYIQGAWDWDCAVDYNNIENDDGRCSEWEWFYYSVPSNITWSADWSCNLDYDSGEKHVDLHSTNTGYAATDMTEITAWVKVDNASIIGTGFISQNHSDPWGATCYDQRSCINGAYYTNDDTFVNAPGEWYDSWTNGDRH